jgi:ABC-type dipeptide/oligopeptide/nickel transport system permease component
MARYFVRRSLSVVPVLILVLLIIFALVRMIPGDPAVTLLGEGATDQQIAMLRAQLHLDQPVWNQLILYAGGLLRGDLGASLRTNRPVLQELLQRLPATIELSLAALLIAIVVGLPLGVLSAAKANRPVDHAVRIMSLVGVSAPAFWLALLLQILFAIQLGWLPVSGRIDVFLRPPTITGFLLIDCILARDWAALWSALHHLVLPACVLAAFLAATISRLLRSSMLEQLRQDYVRTVRAKGLSERVLLYRHVLRNSLLPTVTITGLKFAELLGGAILIETVFAWPGMGRYMYEAITTRDYPVIQGGTVVFALVFIISSLLVDMLYSFLDPRIRVEG